MAYIQAATEIDFQNESIIVSDKTNYANANLFFTNPAEWYPNNRLQFDSFTLYVVKYPSGEVVYFATQAVADYLNIACEIVQSPAQLQTAINLTGQEIGIYTVAFINIPTAVDLNSNFIYNQNDNVYYSGSLFVCSVSGGVQFDPSNATNWRSDTGGIQPYIDSMLLGIQPNNPYMSLTVSFSKLYLQDVFVEILSELACMILREPTRKDLCSHPLFEQYFLLKSILFKIEDVLDTNTYTLELNNMINYVNQYCQR